MSSSTSGSKSENKSMGISNSSFGQEVWKGQQKPLMDMYGQAKDLFSNFDPSSLNGSIDTAKNYANNMAGAAIPAWQQQAQGGYTSGAAAGTNQGLIDSLNRSMSGPSNAGRMYQDIVGGAGNTYIDPMVNSMKEGVMDNVNRQVPGIAADAIGAGQMGSSRHGIAEGLMRSDANKNMIRDEMTMRGQAYDKDLDWKMQIANQADQGIAGAQDRAISLMNAQNQSSQGALNSQQQMAGWGNAGMNAELAGANAPWDIMDRYSNALGDPNVLSSGKSFSFNKGSGSSKGASHGSSIK